MMNRAASRGSAFAAVDGNGTARIGQYQVCVRTQGVQDVTDGNVVV